MLLSDAFPRTAAAKARLLRWDAEFQWAGDAPAVVAYLLNGKMEEAQQAGRETVLELAALIREDLTAETQRVGDGEGAALIDAARFLISIPPILTTLALGQHGDCYSWLHWSASRTHVFNARVNHGEYRLPPFDGAPEGANRLCLASLTDWITAAFMVARKFGGMDSWCAIIIDYCINHVTGDLQAGRMGTAIPAIATIANWTTDRGDPHAEPLIRSLANMFDELDPRSKATISVLFATSASRWTEKTHQEWAHEALHDLRPVLVEHEVVQLLAVTIDTPEGWIGARCDVLREIRTLANEYRAMEAENAATLALEARVAIIHPMIFGLSRFGTVEDILDILWAWYGRDGYERADADVLFIGSAHGDGVAYLWPGGRHIVVGEEEGTLQGLLENLSDALNEYFRGPAGDRNAPLNERMIGAPAYEQAAHLQNAMSHHYRLNELAEALPPEWRPRSIVVVPAHRDPLQALVANTLGWLAPMEASMSIPLPSRSIRRLSIWPGETQTTESEVSFLQAIALRAGWTVTVTPGPLDALAFRRFYEDSEADLLWVIGHGEQSPFRQTESGLVLEDGLLLTSAEIGGYTRPDAGRRLLVLNICSATATQNRGGLARVGFGHDLTSADQMVVGHLWPIDYYAALAFGCSFGLDLSERLAADALKSTIDRMRNPEHLLRALEGVDPEQPAIALLGSERASEQIANLLSWGSPVLLT